MGKRRSKRRSLSKDRRRSGKSKVDRSNNSKERDTNDAAVSASRGIHSETIQKLRSELTMYLTTEYGLLDELRVLGVITRQQVDEIRCEPTEVSRVDHLLNLVVEMSDVHQEQFLTALDNNQLAHISEYIRANGNLSDLNQERWPLYQCGEMRTIEKNWTKLLERIDLKCGLLDELFTVGFLNERQMKSIKDNQAEATQNKELLNLMYSVSFADFKKLLNCLEKTKQCSVIPLLSTSYTGSEQPLNDVTKARLRRYHACLVEHIDLKNGLSASLFESRCITSLQKQFIESSELKANNNARLLEMLRRGSEKDFNVFIDCLSKTGQEHLSKLLQEDGVVMPVVAKTSCSASEEIRIVEGIRDVAMALRSICSDTERVNKYAKIVELLNELSCDVHLIEASKQSSIHIFYLCHSLDGLQRLHNLLSSGHLKDIMERIFTILLDNGTPVVVDRLHWNIRDYINGLQYLYSSVGLEVFNKLYELPTNTHLDLVDCTVSLLRVDQLPSELLQSILNKAVGQLLVIIHRVTPRAAVYAMATVGGVSTLWWRTITSRRYSKRVLKRYFQCVCSPFKCNPQRLQNLCIEGAVNCLTEFNGQLYVGVYRSASVQVFVSRSPFSRCDDITVQGLNDPRDIVTCRDTSQLYIADGGSEYAIWRMNLLHNKQVDKFITIQWEPSSLSVNSTRLLITPWDGAALFLYSDDGSQLNRIQLPDYLVITHAVETTHNTYIVSHGNRWADDTESEHNCVSEVNVDGRVVRTFNSQHIDIGSIQFNWPWYLALDDNNHVIVADRLNERVVVLKSDLQLKRVLIPSLDQQPWRLCLSKSCGLLFTSDYLSSVVDIYKVVS